MGNGRKKEANRKAEINTEQEICGTLEPKSIGESKKEGSKVNHYCSTCCFSLLSLHLGLGPSFLPGTRMMEF